MLHSYNNDSKAQHNHPPVYDTTHSSNTLPHAALLIPSQQQHQEASIYIRFVRFTELRPGSAVTLRAEVNAEVERGVEEGTGM